MLKQEMREPALYNAIILAIANGASKLSEIATKVGETTATCPVYLRNLVLLSLAKKRDSLWRDSLWRDSHSQDYLCS